MSELTGEARAEIAQLALRFGEPIRAQARIRGAFFDPLQRADRFGEVCMVVRRPSGKLIVATKDFYPGHVFRLPTGGIHHGEGILDALLREAHEETGLDVSVRRFLAAIGYLAPVGDEPIFHTFAFLLDETGGTLASLDPDERIYAFGEVDPAELDGMAARLDAIASEASADIGGDWADWGEFRAVVHREVGALLAGHGKSAQRHPADHRADR
jgi:8-oxo-dGTP pyrophosphatase MutT (NUDIX family)